MFRVGLVICVILSGCACAAEQPPAAFTLKPSIKREGNVVRVSFAVNRNTDVAVFIENAKGEIVRHVAAGVLGSNPPAPFKAGTLEQSLDWDGLDDDGKPAEDGPFNARVALSLKVGWGGVAFTEPDKTGPSRIDSLIGLAAGQDGRLYLLDWREGFGFWSGTSVHVLRRDGAYERTIKPLSPNGPLERVKATGAFINTFGKLNPLIHRPLGVSLYPHEDVSQQPVVLPDGRLILAAAPADYAGAFAKRDPPVLVAIDAEGGFAAGPVLMAGGSFCGAPVRDERAGYHADKLPSFASSGDAKSIYVSGLGQTVNNTLIYNTHAIYSVPAAELGPATPWFGDPHSAGDDKTHLSDPRAVATNGKGQLFIADHGNNRLVVLNEKDKSFAGSIPVDAPFWVGVDGKSGAVYAGSNKTTVIKYSGWEDAKEVSRVNFATLTAKVGQNVRASTPLLLALDASTNPPVLWAGRAALLLRCEDLGDKFGEITRVAGLYGGQKPKNLSADPTRKEISCKRGYNTLLVLNEATGKIRTLRPAINYPGVEGTSFRLGLSGKVYGLIHANALKQFDSTTGKPIPFASTAEKSLAKTSALGHPASAAHGVGVDRKGNIYVKHSDPPKNGDWSSQWHIRAYRPDGELIGPVVHHVLSRAALGPRLDAKGNLYIADAIHPPGAPCPEEFKAQLGAVHKGVMWYTRYLYGSVIKFGPKGGAVWLGTSPPDATRDASWKEEAVEVRQKPATLLGAEWSKFGYSPQGYMVGMGDDGCHCNYTDFDVDDFGRTFFPDTARFRTVVLDTNGNEILAFGAYGNQDCCGPESYVLDPKENYYRPRRPDDPRELVSPFAEPEIAIGWIESIAVTDRFAYIADGMNLRVLRVKLEYVAEETVPLP